MAQVLTEVREVVPEVDKIAKALGSLPLKYNNFITAWDSSEEAKQTYDNLTLRLLKEEQRLTQTEEVTTAFISLMVSKTTQHNQAQKKSQGYESRSTATNKSGSDKRNMECFYCQKKGHFKSECRKRQAKQKASQSKNLKIMH